MDALASRRAFAGLVLASLVACGEDGPGVGEPDDVGSTGAAPEADSDAEPERTTVDAEPNDVPRSPPAIEAETWCTALTPGEVLASISPQGHAWLVAADTSTQELRVLDPFSQTVSDVAEIRLPEFAAAQAWTAVAGTIIADRELWRLQGEDRIQLTPPTALAKSVSMCGDPMLSGYVLTGGRLFERRPDDRWWTWDPHLDAAEAMVSIVAQDGACTNADDTIWVVGKDGTLWRLDGDTASRTARFAQPTVAATAGLLGVIDEGVLWVAAPAELRGSTPLWQRWRFDGPAPAQLSASGGALWMLAGRPLLHYQGGTWSEVRHDADGEFEAVHAHQGGAWLVAEDAVCHVRYEPMVRIEGVRPYLHGRDAEYPIFISTTEKELVEAFVDDEPTALVFDDDAAGYAGVVRLETTGWHTVSVVVGPYVRHIDVKRVGTPQRSWSEDIAPLHDAHCTGGGCHGGDDVNAPRALDAYETWVAHAEKIRLRVVDTETMPPPGTQADWGAAQIEVVEQWLDAGMQP